MASLVSYYAKKFKNIDGNVFEMFSKVYESDLTLIQSWLDIQFKKKIVKNNAISTVHRKNGNGFYSKKNLVKSLELYTMSLRYATADSNEYGLALANRSAVFFEMKEFHKCLKDIELCLKTNYPTYLKPKIYVRQAECFYELKEKDRLTECIADLMRCLETTNISDKGNLQCLVEKLRVKLHQLENLNEGRLFMDSLECKSEVIPRFPDGENEQFAFASSKVLMGYSEGKGRHVLASKDIKRGDVLFIEKAFMFAPVFKECNSFHLFKCYHCLKDILNSIPCQICTVCVYCDEKCRDASWATCHQWECNGMQTNIWYDLGIVFPALKTIIKGSLMKHKATENRDIDNDLKKFGDKTNNYPYFDRLIFHSYDHKTLVSYVVMAAIMITYLEKYTDFFYCFLKQPHCPKNDYSQLIKHVGGIATKHIAQLSCNSSLIEHWTTYLGESLFPEVLLTIACAVYPSVAIMNHSCKPNVTNYFISDIIVVKALEDIPRNGEIFNSYGIDYRVMQREQRQYACRKLYYFECNCVICANPANEVHMFDSYLCKKCKGVILEASSSILGCCVNCGEQYDLTKFNKINNDAQKLVENAAKDNFEALLKSLNIREKILHKYHKDFEEIYDCLYRFYVQEGDLHGIYKYFHMWLLNEKARRGCSSRCIGTKLYEAALAILHCLESVHPHCLNIKDYLQKVENMIKEAKAIVNLYYPEYITNRLITNVQRRLSTVSYLK